VRRLDGRRDRDFGFGVCFGLDRGFDFSFRVDRDPAGARPGETGLGGITSLGDKACSLSCAVSVAMRSAASASVTADLTRNDFPARSPAGRTAHSKWHNWLWSSVPAGRRGL
jgi:hypothetical protein